MNKKLRVLIEILLIFTLLLIVPLRAVELDDFVRDGGLDFIRKHGDAREFDRILAEARAEYARTGAISDPSRLGTRLHSAYRKAYIDALKAQGAEIRQVDFGERSHKRGVIARLGKYEFWFDVPSGRGAGFDLDLIVFEVETETTRSRGAVARGVAMDMTTLGPLDSRAGRHNRVHYREKCFGVKSHVDDLTGLGHEVEIDVRPERSAYFMNSVLGRDPKPWAFRDLDSEELWVKDGDKRGWDVVRHSTQDGVARAYASTDVTPTQNPAHDRPLAIREAEYELLGAQLESSVHADSILGNGEAYDQLYGALPPETQRRYTEIAGKALKKPGSLTQEERKFLGEHERLLRLSVRRRTLQQEGEKHRRHRSRTSRTLADRYAEIERLQNTKLSYGESQRRGWQRVGEFETRHVLGLQPVPNQTTFDLGFHDQSGRPVPVKPKRISSNLARVIRTAQGPRALGTASTLLLVVASCDAAVAASAGDTAPAFSLAGSVFRGVAEETLFLALAVYGGIPGTALYVAYQGYSIAELGKAFNDLAHSFSSEIERAFSSNVSAGSMLAPMTQGVTVKKSQIQRWPLRRGAKVYQFNVGVTVYRHTVSVDVGVEKLQDVFAGLVGEMEFGSDTALERVEVIYTDGATGSSEQLDPSRSVAGVVVHFDYVGKQWTMRFGAAER